MTDIRFKPYKDIYFYYSLLFVLFLFTNVSIFSIYAFLIIVLLNHNRFLPYGGIFVFTTITFYILRFSASISDKFNGLWKSLSLSNYASDERFWDLQLNLISMKCIVGNVENYYLKFSTTSYKSCPYSAKYGPLSTKIPYIGDIWVGTIIFSFLGIASLIFIYFLLIKREADNKLYCSILLLISPINFVVERMNIDLFIFLFLLLAIINYSKYPRISILLVLFLSLYKIHPLGVMIGLLFYSYFIDNKKNIDYIINSLVSFFTIYFLDAIFFTSTLIDTEWRPAGLDITFGILSDAIILSKFIENNAIVNYLFILLTIFIFVIFFDFSSILNFSKFTPLERLYYLSFVFLFFVNTLYANYDYRIPLFFPCLFLIIKYGSRQSYFLVFFAFVMPVDLKISLLNLEMNLIQNIVSLIGRLSIYSFLIINLQLVKKIIFQFLNFEDLKTKFTSKIKSINK